MSTPRPAASWRSSRQIYQQFRHDLKHPPATDPQTTTATAATPSTTRRENFRAYLKVVFLFRWQIAAILGLAIVVSVLEVYQPRLIGEAIDQILQNPALSTAEKNRQLLHSVLMLLGMVVMARALDSWRDYRTHRLNARVLSRLRRLLYGHLLRFPLARLHDLKTGGIVSRLTGDLEALTGLVQMAFISPLVAVLRVGFAFFIVWQWIPCLARCHERRCSNRFHGPHLLSVGVPAGCAGPHPTSLNVFGVLPGSLRNWSSRCFLCPLAPLGLLVLPEHPLVPLNLHPAVLADGRRHSLYPVGRTLTNQFPP